MNEMAEDAKQKGFISSDNFMTYIIHEWMHNVHLTYLYKKNGFNEKEVAKYIKKISKIEFNSTEKTIIQEELGEYVHHDGNINAMEVIAEGLNKIICSCLDENKLGINLSIDESVKKMPEKLINILQKILTY